MTILASRRFLPLFVTQFLGAFNDNLFKSAMVMLIAYRFTEAGEGQILVTAAAGVFILPFFLFSAMAGQLADKFDRARLARLTKLAEIVIMLVAVAGFLLPSVPLLMVVLFCMGTQSAFFGPVKYAILPQHLAGNELLSGNAWVEAATFLAILLGTIVGGLLVAHAAGVYIICGFVLIVALSGYAASRFILTAPGPDPEMTINRNIWRETMRILSGLRDDVVIYRCILAISWFWLVGATYLSQFPAFGRDFIGGDPTVVTLLLTVFSLGIGAGSVLCSHWLKGVVQLTYVPLAAIGMAVFGIDLYFATRGGAGDSGILMNAMDFLAGAGGWRVMADLFAIAVCGGLFVVPLYAMVQKYSPPVTLARTIAGLNVMNAMFMVVSAIVAAVLLAASVTIPEIFLLMALCNVLVALYIVQLLPADLFRSVVRMVLSWCYAVDVRGLENVEAAGKRVLIIANHSSFLDAALIAAFLPVRITFAVNTWIARKWWFRPVRLLVDAFPLDPTNPMAIKSLVDVVRQDKTAMIFPEGRITVTGALMKVYEGPGLIADKADAMILPVRIDGAQYSPFSRLRGKVRIRSFPKITLTILPPRRFELPPEIKGRRRRQLSAAKLYDIMSGMMFDSSETERTLPRALIDAARLHGMGRIIAEDPLRQPVSYRDLISRSFTLGRVIVRAAQPAGNATVAAIGVMLPNMNGTVMTIFGLQAAGRVPAMLNFSAGPAQILSACETAQIRDVVTARRFVEMGKLSPVVALLEENGIRLHYLEDLRNAVTLHDKLFGLSARYLPELALVFGKKLRADDAAVVLFTSGSEGTPKGVVLSHRNIRANLNQIASRIDFGPSDIVFNCLPMFHSFGLTGGTLLPALSGIRAFYYPSPLHYRIVPELVYDTNATIMFGTDTFLSGYARFAHAYDFHSIRYIFAGAEKLRDETRRIYAEKFGVRLFEGYGATETAPVISINTPMHNRPGTVGRALPGMSLRVEPVAGVEGDNTGRLIVRGPNIMKGYLKSDAPGVLQPPEDGWYDTGDIVAIDEEGFIAIRGRLKRFAKIGGEMVSLTAVEAAVQQVYPQAQNAVVSVKDDRKGEKLILFTTQTDARTEDLLQYFRQKGMSELTVPRQVQVVESLPLLGTGKTDYVGLQKIADAQ